MWVKKDLVVVGPDGKFAHVRQGLKQHLDRARRIIARVGPWVEHGAEKEHLTIAGHLDPGMRIAVLDEEGGWLKFRIPGDDRAYITSTHRGGCWLSHPRACRSAYRLAPEPPTDRRTDVGFRAALGLTDASEPDNMSKTDPDD